MQRSLWSVAVVALAMGGLAMVGGTAIAGELGPLTVGYGLLVILGALYMLTGLAIRDRVWRRLAAPRDGSSPVQSLSGRRVF